MAGIGIKLNKLFGKHTITSSLLGMGYSAAVTITPMIVIIGNVWLTQRFLGFSKLTYMERELFACILLYMFIFSLLVTSPLNAVISRLLSDIIFEERFEDIMACFYMGLMLNIIIAAVLGIPFCIKAYFVGHISLVLILIGYVGYMALVLLFYVMAFLGICKTYEKIMLFYLVGMIVAFLTSAGLKLGLGIHVSYAILIGLTVGFLIASSLAYALLRQYFVKCSSRYTRLLTYIIKYWQLVVANFLYAFGLYVHNFVFWHSELQVSVANGTFIHAGPYDLASYIAMLTNLSATIIFIANVEMHFHGIYKSYSEAIIGGRHQDIEKAKGRMFRRLAAETMTLARVQFIISVVLYLLFMLFLPRLGINGLTLIIYPVLAAGYFVLFLMYSAFIFLYYFNDLNGALLMGILFASGTFIGSLFSMTLPRLWYGLGLFIGSMVGWTYAYFRLRWVERHIDEHIFCKGDILNKRKMKKPSNVSYRRESN